MDSADATTVPPLIAAVFAADANHDTEAFLALLTPDAAFHFAGLPPAVGREAVRESVQHFFDATSEIRHELVVAFRNGDTMAWEGRVHMVFHDGRVLDIPYANVVRLAGDLVADYRIYLDRSVLA